MSDRIKLEVMADGSVSLNGTRVTLGKMWGIQKIVFSKYASKEWIVDALGVEKEIRNKAIDEFVNALKNSSNMHKWSCGDMTLEFCNGDDCDECENEFMKEIYEIAEQMKGE